MTPTTSDMIRYSPRPFATYKQLTPGNVLVGPAASSFLRQPEAWNLAYLSFPFEAVLSHPDPWFSTVIRRTLQTVLNTGVIDLADAYPDNVKVVHLMRMPAPQAVVHLTAHAAKLPAFKAYGAEWLSTIQTRARLMCVDDHVPDNVTDVSEARALLQQIFRR